MVSKQVKVINKAGMHLRAAAKLVELSAGFGCEIRIGHDKMVDGKSILSVMMLQAVQGTCLNVEADGPEEQQALDAVVALIDDRFGESE